MTKTNQEILEESWREEFKDWYHKNGYGDEDSLLIYEGSSEYAFDQDEHLWQGYLAACKKRQEEIDFWRDRNNESIEHWNEKVKEIAQLKAEVERLKGFWKPIIEKFETKYPNAGRANTLALTALTESFDIHCENENLKQELAGVNDELTSRSMSLENTKQDCLDCRKELGEAVEVFEKIRDCSEFNSSQYARQFLSKLKKEK